MSKLLRAILEAKIPYNVKKPTRLTSFSGVPSSRIYDNPLNLLPTSYGRASKAAAAISDKNILVKRAGVDYQEMPYSDKEIEELDVLKRHYAAQDAAKMAAREAAAKAIADRQARSAVNLEYPGMAATPAPAPAPAAPSPVPARASQVRKATEAESMDIAHELVDIHHSILEKNWKGGFKNPTGKRLGQFRMALDSMRRHWQSKGIDPFDTSNQHQGIMIQGGLKQGLLDHI